MKEFNPINRPVQPSYTLEVLSNSYNTIEQGHKEAIKAASELETAMASLDLNEAEDEFRQAKINEIKSTINDNLTFGNAYTALPSLIAKAGDIASDPQMLGRLRAQQDYKTFRDAVDARTDIPDDYKEYYKNINPYQYQDKFDNKGNIIGGTKWTPNDTPVESIDINEIFKEAISYASPDSGSYTGVKFLNSDNTISDKWTPGASISVFNTSTRSWEKLTEDKLYEGVMAAMRANPKVKASLEQDFKILNYNYNKGDKVHGLFNADGSRKTFNEYVESIVDPFIKAKKYNNIISKVDYNETLLNNLAKSSAEQPSHPTTFTPQGNIGHASREINKSKVETFANVNSAEAVARKEVAKVAPDIDPFAITINDIPTMQKVLRDRNVSEDRIAEISELAQSLYDANREDFINYENIRKTGDKKGFAAYQMNASLETGIPINPKLYEDNPDAQRIIREHDNISESYFDKSNGGTGIEQTCTDRNRLNRFIENIGGQQVLNELGINITYDSDGDAKIFVPAEIGTNFGRFADAYTKAYDSTNTFLKLGNLAKRATGFGDAVHRVYSDGSRKQLGIMDKAKADYNARTNAGAVITTLATAGRTGSVGSDVSPAEMYAPIKTFKDRMQRLSTTAVGPEEQIMESISIPGVNVTAAMILDNFKDTLDSKALTAANKALKMQQTRMVETIRSINFNSTGVLIYDDKEGAYVNSSTGDIEELKNFIQNKDNLNKISGNIEFIPAIGKFYYAFTLPVKDGEAPKRFRFVDFKDKNLQDLNANPELAGIASVTKAFSNGRILNLGKSEGGYLSATASIDDTGTKYFKVTYDDGSKFKNISVDAVHKIKGTEEFMKYWAKRANPNTEQFKDSYIKFREANLGVISNDENVIKKLFIDNWNSYARQ